MKTDELQNQMENKDDQGKDGNLNYESSGGSVYSKHYDNIRLDLDDLADINLFRNNKRK